MQMVRNIAGRPKVVKTFFQKNFYDTQKNYCTQRVPCYSLLMQANSIINDDFNTQTQSDEFASEYEAWLELQEQNYWREIDAQGN